MSKKKLTVEQEYALLSQEEQILLRPDTMIGSVEEQTDNQWAYNFDTQKIEKQELTYIPAYLKLFDEILTNASDHAQRGKGVKTIKVNIDPDWKITVWNDGEGIPVVIHKEHNMYVPEMVLGKLNSGSNYNDQDERYGAGRNGVGSAVVALFSKTFIIDCADGKKKYYQELNNNAREKTQPIIKNSTVKPYTCVSYITDHDRLPIGKNKEDTLKLCIKRIFDIAVYNPDVKIYFNDELIKIKSIKDWIALHTKDQEEIFIEKIDDKWEVGLIQSETETFEHCSIVNGNTTWEGGTHVDMFMNNIVKQLTDELTKGKKGIKIRPSDIKNKFHLFLVSKVANPSFDTQTKVKLKTRIQDKVDLSSKTYKDLKKSKIMESILEWVQLREQAQLKKLNTKAAGKTIRVEKLVDAHNAGTKKSEQCGLFIAEGDCIEENTLVKVFRNGDYIETKIKHTQLGDAIITHNGNIREIYGITKKVKECKTISYNNTEITLTNEHRLLVYDKDINSFDYIKAVNLNKNKHQLVKSKLYNLDYLIKIHDIIITNDKKYNYKLILKDGVIESSSTHKFTIINLNKSKFELVEAKDLKINDLIVSVTPT